jgi:hypothetical protein
MQRNAFDENEPNFSPAPQVFIQNGELIGLPSTTAKNITAVLARAYAD